MEQIVNREAVVFSKLREWRDSGQFCDLEVILGQKTIRAHACIVAAAVPLIQKRIALKCSPTSSRKSPRYYSLQFNNLSPYSDLVESIVDHVYGCPLHITEANVGNLLEVALLLHYTSAVEECLRFMSENVTTSTAFPWYRLLTKSFEQSRSNVQKLKSFIKNDFSEILKTEDLLSLPRLNVEVVFPSQDDTVSEQTKKEVFLSVFEKYIVSEAINTATFCERTVAVCGDELLGTYSDPQPFTTSEGDCFESPYRPAKPFVKAVEETRPCSFEKSAARQLVLDGEDLSNSSLIVAKTDQASCSIALVYTQKNFVILNVIHKRSNPRMKPSPSPTTGIPMDPDSDLAFLPSMKEARSSFGCLSTSEGIVAFGGYNRNGCLSSVEVYTEEKGWASLPDLFERRGRLDGAVVRDTAYAFGGSNGSWELNTWEVVNSDCCELASQSSFLPSLPSARSEFAAVSAGDKVLLIGGCNQSVALSSVMQFSTKHFEWSARQPLNSVRAELSAVEHNGLIYAIGGTDHQHCLSSVEFYSIDDNLWQLVSPMTCPRRGAAAVSFGDRLYVLGGYDGTQILKSVETYCPETDAWSQCSPMNVPRCGARAVVYRNHIYVLGGYSSWGFLTSIDCYDPSTDVWTSFC